MPFMQIESIEIRNYRVFRNAVFKNLPKLTVLIGANGTGKSTLFDVFSFLKDVLTHNVGKAVGKRGGFRELVSRGAAGPITLTFKFRETGGRLATYKLAIANDGGKPVVEREILKFRRGQRGKPWPAHSGNRDCSREFTPNEARSKRCMGALLSGERNRSRSFQVFLTGVQRFAAEMGYGKPSGRVDA